MSKFISSKKNFEISEGGRTFVIPRNFIGTIPDWVAGHWLVQAAIRDGSIATPDNTADRALEAADTVAEEKAVEYDIRPDVVGEEENVTEKPDKEASGSRRKK